MAANPGATLEITDATITRFRAGKVDALGTVYDHFSRAVWSTAMSVLRDRQLAEDATQETFLRAWRAADSFDAERSLAPWLLTIARRTALDVYRREHRPTRGDHAEEQDVAIDAPEMVAAWEAWQIRLAIDQLSTDEQRVIELSHFGGLTHEEISRSIRIPVGTVKSRSHRAHRRLAELLDHLSSGREAR